MSLLRTIVEKIVSKVEITQSLDRFTAQARFTSPKDALITEIYHTISEQYREEVEKLEQQAAERRQFEADKEIAKAELARDRKLMELDLATKRDTLETAIKMETDEEKRKLMQTAVENVALKEKVDYLQNELSFYREMSKDSSKAVNDTLRTAFQNPAKVVIENKT